jgi:hypothetical protein
MKDLKQFIKTTIREILNEQTEQQSSVIYHFVDEKKLVNILTKNELKPRWKHYIESEDRIVVGTSFTWDLKHNTVSNMEYPIKMIFDRSKLERDYKSFLINSSRVHLQTMAQLKPNLYDTTAYKYEDETPNELFVEGTIKPLINYVIDIEILKPISKETEQLILNFKRG